MINYLWSLENFHWTLLDLQLQQNSVILFLFLIACHSPSFFTCIAQPTLKETLKRVCRLIGGHEILCQVELISLYEQDYEYSSYNPIAFDIANHFCEMAADYHTEIPHVLDYKKYPGENIV